MSKNPLFSGKNGLVFGAPHPVGQAICARLVAQGGFVVAVDGDENRLQTLSSTRPDRIAPLALDMGDTAALARLSRHWAHDPLHLVIFAHALSETAPLDCVLGSVAAATRALAPRLAASDGAAVLLFRQSDTGGTALGRAAARALASLTEDLAEEGARINALALYPAALAMPDRVATTALMMALPLSRAVSGAVLPVGRHG